MKRMVVWVVLVVLLFGTVGCNRLPASSDASLPTRETTGERDDSGYGSTITDAVSDGTVTDPMTSAPTVTGDTTGTTSGLGGSSATGQTSATTSAGGQGTVTNGVDTPSAPVTPHTTTTTTVRRTTTTTTRRTTIATQAGHKHTVKRTITQPPTCTEQGYTLVEYPCCGATEAKTNLVPALGHMYGEWHVTKSPTNTAAGEKTRVCLRCPYEEKQAVAKLPMTNDGQKKAILDLVNVERTKAGLPALSYYMAEEAAASQRVTDIKTKFNHYRPDGQPFYSIMPGLGVDYMGCGENIASGFNTPESVMVAWMNSPGHRANILDPDFDALVVGVKDGYWVQLFIDF